eukprot:scpid78416/ scgid4502/ 
MAAYMGILYEFGRLAHFRGYCCCGGVDYNKWDELCAERRSAEGCLVHRSGYCCCHFKAKFSEDVPSIAAELSKALDQDQRTSESNLPPSSAVGVEGNHDGDNNAAPRVDPESNAETADSDAAADLPVRVSSTESDNDDRPTLVTRNTSSEQQSQLAYADRDYCPPSDVHTRETGDQSEPASPHEVPTELSTEGLWETIRKLEKIISENRYQDMRQTQTKVGEQEVIERRTKDLIRETSEVREEKGKLGALLEKVQRDEAVWNIMNSTLRTEIEAAVGVHRTNPSLDPTEAFQETELAEQPADAPVLQVVGSSMPKNVETDMRDATSKPATWQGNKHQEHQPRVMTARSSFGLDILQAENVSEALSSGTASDSLDT